MKSYHRTQAETTSRPLQGTTTKDDEDEVDDIKRRTRPTRSLSGAQTTTSNNPEELQSKPCIICDQIKK